MINIALALIILGIAMYISIEIVNFIFNIAHLAKSPDMRSPNLQRQSILERLISSAGEYLQWSSFSTHQEQIANSINASEMEMSAVCSEVATNIEGIEEGLQVLAESAGEHIITAIDNLSNA